MLASTMAWTIAGLARAESPLLDGLFVDHAVLQRDRPIVVSGRAAPGEEVHITLAGASSHAKADAKGAWSLALPAMGAGGPHTLAARSATRSQTVNDVLVGDVWLC